eukprot:scaffold27053_cov155-Skeletonema_menzelii.AAC.6
MAKTWDWDWTPCGVQQTTEQKPTLQPTMNAWNAPQSPQGREAPTMYSTNSPGERVESCSPGSSDNNYQLQHNNYQLQPVQNAGYQNQNYQLEGQHHFVQLGSQTSPHVSAPASAPPPLPHVNFSQAPAMPSQQAAAVTPQAQAANPFDVFAPAVSHVTQPAATHAPVDPFGAAPHTPTPPTSSLPEDDDFWGQMGFGQIDHAANVPTGCITPTSDLSVSDTSDASFTPEANPYSLDERGLPVGGEYYMVRVTTELLGAIFTSASELRTSLYKTASFQFVESLKQRPVVSFRIDGSAADTSGVEIGHVLLKVNGQDILDTDTAVRALVESPRPMMLEFYAPGRRQVHITKTEGKCMVKYDTRESMHPRTSREWKPKYVVIGDLLGKPNVIYMYRSKAEYDIAVKESQSRPRTLSVKVKQFDITGARILKRGQVRYTNQPTPWYYFVIVREFGLPIKISAESEEELSPVYNGIAAYLAESKKRAAHTPPSWMK